MWLHGTPADPAPELDAAELATLPPAELLGAYAEYLARAGVLAHGFSFSELVRPTSPEHQLPPPKLWRNIVPTLVVAIELRERMLTEGATGLSVRAAYRPAGGKPRSAHKVNCALDLDLLATDLERRPGLARTFLQVAAGLYAELLESGTRVGMGSYGPPHSTRRIHVDINHAHPARPNTWTIRGKVYTAPALIAALEGRP